MKKALLSLFVTLSFIGFGLSRKLGISNEQEFSVRGSGRLPKFAAPTPALALGTSTPMPTARPTVRRAGVFRDGQYTGSVADAYYGNVQVRVTTQNGAITNVVFLQYPNDRDTSRYINGLAMPYLIQEAIQSQNAQVDIISGATDTSGAFRESLASALAQAR